MSNNESSGFDYLMGYLKQELNKRCSSSADVKEANLAKRSLGNLIDLLDIEADKRKIPVLIHLKNFKEFRIARTDKGEYVGYVYQCNNYIWILRVGRCEISSNDHFIEEMMWHNGIPKAEAIANLQEVAQKLFELLSNPAKYIDKYGEHTGDY